MNTTARRYVSPSTPPRLIPAPPRGALTAGMSPVLCLRCGGRAGHAASRLVSFDWGRVAVPNSRR